MNLEIISRLDPGACRFDMRVDGAGSAKITMELLAGAMASLSAEQSEIVRAMVLHDANDVRRLIERVRGMIIDRPSKCDWHLLQIIPKIVIQSVIIPTLCPCCEGRGHLMEGAKLVDCYICSGTGKLKRTEAELEKMANVTRREWILMQEEYDRCIDIVHGWLGSATRIIKEQLDETY